MLQILWYFNQRVSSHWGLGCSFIYLGSTRSFAWTPAKFSENYNSVKLKFTIWANVMQVPPNYSRKKVWLETSQLHYKTVKSFYVCFVIKKKWITIYHGSHKWKTNMKKIEGKHETFTSRWFVTHDQLSTYVRSVVSESVIFNTTLVADVWVFASIREFPSNLVMKRIKVRFSARNRTKIN